MNREQILKMEAGRKMDALVAIKVMEKVFHPRVHSLYWDELPSMIVDSPDRIKYPAADEYCMWGNCPHYSTDISAAWEILYELENSKREILSEIVRAGVEEYKDMRWDVVLRECVNPWRRYIATENTAPLAICRAALLAILTE